MWSRVGIGANGVVELVELGAGQLGRRVSVRRRVEGGLTDVVGFLVDETPASLTVLRASGEVVVVARADVTAAKVVPEAPVRRGWAVPELSAADLQRICWAGWPAREAQLLGDWALRAHGGITGRANSAMAVGDPGMPVPAALDRVAAFYGERGLPPLVQLPLADPADAAMESAGWSRVHVTAVQVAPIGPVLQRLPGRTDLTAAVEPAPDETWRALMHDLDKDDPDAHVAILAGPPVVGFATVRRDEEPVGIGRVSVEGDWAGVTSLDVAPAVRRAGIGSAVMRALLGWAASRGAQWSYLQVRVANDAALRLYARLGYVTHHPYTYRAPLR